MAILNHPKQEIAALAALDHPKGESAAPAAKLPRWDSWIHAGSTSTTGTGVFRVTPALRVVVRVTPTLRVVVPPALRVVPSHSPELVRRFLRRQSPKVRLSLLVGLVAVVLVTFTRIAAPRQTPLNYYLSVLWSLYVPLAALGIVGSIYLVRQRRPRRDALHAVPYARHMVPGRRVKPARSSFNGLTDRLLIVTIPTLLAEGNLTALQRVLTSTLVNLPRHFVRFHVDVVTEGDTDDRALRSWIASLGELGKPVRIVNVPSEYATPLGSKFKTRANHHAMEVRREVGENTSDAYVYHLDDDTHIGPDTAASLAEFIERDGRRYLLAQGVLTFPHCLTRSWFCRLADSIRPADDLTRFAFFTGFLGTPLGGLHGEHLIVRADIEDEIGWDFPNTVIEDAYFAIQFAVRYPRRSTMLNSYSYGASPATVRDLVRQRRRWIEGLLRLACNRRLPLAPKIPLLYSIFTWSLAPFQFVGFALLVSYVTGTNDTSPVSPWIIPLWSFSLGYFFWLYIEGLKINMSASDRPRSYVWLAILIVPSIYIITVVETFAAVLGIVRFFGIGRQRVSEVITKPI